MSNIVTVHSNRFKDFKINLNDTKMFFKKYPITSGLLIIFLIVHLYVNNCTGSKYMFVYLNSIFDHLFGLLRLPLYGFYHMFIHIDFIHLLMNSLSLLQLRHIEKRCGMMNYCTMLIYFAIMTRLLTRYIYIISNNVNIISIGFSGILFGLITLYPPSNIFGVKIHPQLIPVALLFLTQMTVRNAGFIGHLSGILAAWIFMLFRVEKIKIPGHVIEFNFKSWPNFSNYQQHESMSQDIPESKYYHKKRIVNGVLSYD